MAKVVSKNHKKRARRRRSKTSSSSAARNPIDGLGSTRLFSRDERIFRKGQPAGHIYKVQFGCVRTYAQFNKGRRLVIGFYFPGDYFGLEMGKKHGYSADVMVPSMILVIGKRTLMSRAMSNIAVAKRMLDITHVELQRAQNHSLLLRRSAEERVAQFLFDMKKRNRRKELDLFMSRQDIADHLNLTIESVSRVFTRLEKASAISFLTHRRVAVHIRKPIAA